MGRTSVKAVNKYIQKAYDRINFVMPKGRKSEIQECAKKDGISASAWINCAIAEKLGNSCGVTKESGKAFTEFAAEIQGLDAHAERAGMRIEEYVKSAIQEKMARQDEKE